MSAVKACSKNATKLGALLKTSTSLTAKAQGYWKQMSDDGAGDVAAKPDDNDSSFFRKPCIMAFDGAAYGGLNVRDTISADESSLGYLNDHLRIVDPLYGWLRPMDAIEAYRLEMASRDVFSSLKRDDDYPSKLQDFWKPAIASLLKDESETARTPVVVVNLASDEYSAAVDPKAYSMAKIVFKHGGRTIAVHAKRARGLMVRYATLTKASSLRDLQAFDWEGYTYRPSESTLLLDGDDESGIESLLVKSGGVAPDETETTTTTKTKKKAQPLTMVFDRPGTWKRST